MGQASAGALRVSAQITDHAQYLSGVPASRFYTDPRMMIDVSLAVSEYYGLDTDAFPDVFYDVYNIEAEALGQRLIYTESAMPDVDQTNPLIKTPGDLAKLRTPDPYRDGRMPLILEYYRYLRECTRAPVTVAFCAPFSLAALLRGYANLVLDMKSDPSFAHALLATVTEGVLIPYVSVLLGEAGAGSAAIGADAWASAPNVSLPIVEEFVVPYALRLRKTFGNAAICGWWGESYLKRPLRLIELKLQVTGNMVYGYDPDVAKLGPRLWKDFAVAHNAELTLGVDAKLLRDGPVEAIVAKVRDYVRVGAPGGNFTLLLNNIPADTPSLHVHAALAAAAAYGQAVEPADFDRVRVVVPRRESFVEFAAKRGVPARTPSL